MRSSILNTSRFLRNYSTAAPIVWYPCLRQMHDNNEPLFELGRYFLGNSRYDHITDLPNEQDWFAKGVARVRDQGVLGTCNVMAAVGAIESAEAIFRNRKIPLSDQEAVDFCRWNCGVNGGSIAGIFDFVAARGGLCKESDYPYVGYHRPQKTSDLPKSGNILGYQHANTTLRFFQALSQQPLASSMVVTQAYENYSGKGIFTTPFESKEYEDEVRHYMEMQKMQGAPLKNERKLKEEARRQLLTKWFTHAVLIVGYKAGGLKLEDTTIKLLESAGTGWGAGGLCEMQFDVAMSLGLDVDAFFPVL